MNPVTPEPAPPSAGTQEPVRTRQPETASTAVPVSVRQVLPDQLRGVALLGIVLVNMPFLALGSAGFTPASTVGVADRVTEFVVVAFAQGKFYLLFSFLFGYSLTLLLRDRSADGLTRYRRRLVGLAVLGLAHGTLFFIGDILLSYAVLGIVLLWFVARSDRAALVGAGITYAIGVCVLVLAVWAVVADGGAGGGGIVDDGSALDRALLGSFHDAALGRAAALPQAVAFQAIVNWSFAVSMFLLGLVAGRRGLLSRPDEHRQLWRRLLILAGAVGLPAAVVSAALFTAADPTSVDGTVQQALAVAIGFTTAPALTAGYVALAALNTRSRALGMVAPAGRMSLTGYLGESILLAAIFCGWGFGLLGELTAFPAALVALAVWAGLELFAKLWLARFRYGPFEWLLRLWSNRRVPPWRAPRAGQDTA